MGRFDKTFTQSNSNGRRQNGTGRGVRKDAAGSTGGKTIPGYEWLMLGGDVFQPNVYPATKKSLFLILLIALVISVLHRNHIAGMFESDRHFSHLSQLERELTFRTEMGLYYSYYNMMIEAPSVLTGLERIMFDNVTEYPLTINTLKRFNLYPEVLLGIGYRTYTTIAEWFHYKTKQCWQVNRGEHLKAVQSCEGLGEPAYFYVEAVFLLNGLGLGIFYLLAVYVSGSLFGGLISVLFFFYNHGECTRVQWTPPLRESFAYPFLLVQILVVTSVIRSQKPSRWSSILVALSTVCYMLPWQFAQFSLLTQTLSLFGANLLWFISTKTLQIIISGQALGLVISAILLFGNEMLFTSFYCSCLIGVWVTLRLENFIKRLKYFVAIFIFKAAVMCSLTLLVKNLISRMLNVADDAHIGDIFRSKFSDFKNFHTMLYTCAPEFDFLEVATEQDFTAALINNFYRIFSSKGVFHFMGISIQAFNLIRLTFRDIQLYMYSQLQIIFSIHTLDTLLLLDEVKAWEDSKLKPADSKLDSNSNHTHSLTNGAISSSSTSSSSIEARADLKTDDNEKESVRCQGDLLYHVIQLVCFTAMAGIIMRLKLFWTPQLCLLCSLLPSRKFCSWIGPISRHRSVIGVAIAMASVQGVANIQHQWSIHGEFSNHELEQLVDFISSNTSNNSVFAGPMPAMATVKLCTGRPIVNHPHYEDTGLRERTKLVYSIYSRKSERDVWLNHRQLQVNYIVLEDSWCTRAAKPGCALPDVWDLEDSANKGGEAVCSRLRQSPGPYFSEVFKNSVYTLLKVQERT